MTSSLPISDHPRDRTLMAVLCVERLLTRKPIDIDRLRARMPSQLRPYVHDALDVIDRAGKLGRSGRGLSLKPVPRPRPTEPEQDGLFDPPARLPRRICQRCGSGFDARGDAKFCSDACRQSAYRARTSPGPSGQEEEK